MTWQEKEKAWKLLKDKQLLEFEERGGVNAVLKEIFLPNKDSPETDSVYRLKQNCKHFYVRKDEMAKELVENLDALVS